MRTRTPGIAAIYARVSTERQATGDRTSLDRQEKNCRKAAAKLDCGMTVTTNTDYIIKEAHSASDPDDRPGLERLRRAARLTPQPFQYVLMDVVDRTTRGGPFDLGEICNGFLHAGVEPIWASHPEWDMHNRHDQNEAAKEAIRAFEDKETVARRFQEGKTERMENGDLIRCYLDYGYKWNAERPRYLSEYDEDNQDPRNAWVLNDDPRTDGKLPPAKVVERIFTYLANGWRTNSDASAVKLMDQLNGEHIPTPSQVKRRRGFSTSWNVPTITSIVHNPSYKGTRPQNRWLEDTTKARERRAAGLKTARELIERPKSAWKWVDVPPIVDEATWEDANKQLARNRTNNHRPPTRYTDAEVLLYGGIVRCAYCHYSMTPTHYTESSPNWYYLCTKGTRPAGRECSGHYPRIRASEVDSRVWSEACRIIRDEAYLRSRLAAAAAAEPDLDADIAYHAAEIARLDAEDSKTTAEMLAWGGDLDYASLRANALATVKHNAEMRRGHTAERDAAVAEKERRASSAARLTDFAERATALAPTLDDLTPEERRQIVLDLHPLVEVGIPHDFDDNAQATGTPRVSVLFSLSEEAYARAQPHTRLALGWRIGADGNYYVTEVRPVGWQRPAPEPFNLPGSDETFFGVELGPAYRLDEEAADVIDFADPTPEPADGEQPAKLPKSSTRHRETPTMQMPASAHPS